MQAILLAMTVEESSEKTHLYEELEKELQETIIAVSSANSSGDTWLLW